MAKADDQKAAARAAYSRQLQAAQRLLAVKRARESLLEFTRLSMPDPEAPDDPAQSRYQVHPVHRFLAEKLEAVERGDCPRLIVNVHPRIGKSLLVSQRFPAWFVGRDPYRQVIVTSHTDKLAEKFGRANRDAFRGSFYRQVFPDAQLKKGSQSASDLELTEGGYLAYRGITGSLTGLGADLLVIDDAIKSREDANSRTLRDKIWEGFVDDAMSRLMGGMGRVVIVMTRWHEDDLVGRLIDPKNPHYDPEIAAQYEVVNIPAIIETEKDKADDPFGRDFGEVLWEERIPKAFLRSQQRLNPSGFAALYQGRPTPPDGNFFKRQHLKTYKPNDLPTNLRYYAASDHAVSEKEKADPTCLGTVGVDEDNNVWVLPDLVWRKMDAQVAVEAMLDQMRRYRQLAWWAERGHISQSIGPFLRTRMLEEQVFVTIDEKTPVKDKQTRAQAIQGRMSMGKVFFPEFAPWWPDAMDELLSFPYGAHDDFVDFLAWIGIGLSQLVPAESRLPRRQAPQTGSIQWIVQSADRIRQQQSAHDRRYTH